MAKYTIISDVGKALTNILRDKLVPEPIDKPEKIGVCEPKDRGGYVVGIHPYDIQEDLTSQKNPPIKLPDGQEQDPPSLMELYYMISVSSKSEIEVRSAEESRIIGKIIQVFKDNRIIPQKYLSSESTIENIPISMIPLEMEEKVKIWTMFGESYKLSVFFLVGPVAIDSENVRKPNLVETVILGSVQRIPRKIVQFETRIKEEDIDDEYTQDYQSEEEEEGEDEFGAEEDEYGDESDEESLGDEEESLDEESEESEGEDESDEDESGDEEGTEEDEDIDELIDDLDSKEDSDNESSDEGKKESDEDESDDEEGTEEDEDIDELIDDLDNKEDSGNESSDEGKKESDKDESDDEEGTEEDENDNKESNDADKE